MNVQRGRRDVQVDTALDYRVAGGLTKASADSLF
jgi:hypothetical protein